MVLVNIRLKANTSRALEYLLVFAASCAVVGIRYVLHPWLNTEAPLFVLILAPIIASLYGTGPALFSTGLCLIGGWFLFLEPYNSFYLQTVTDVLRITIFAIAGVSLGIIGGLRRDALKAAEASRQRQELAVKAADLGVFEWNLRQERGIWENARMYEIFGYSPTDVTPGRQEFYESCVHREDAAALKASLQRSMKP